MSDLIKPILNKTNSVFLKIAAISTATIALVGVYSFYRNQIWHPKIEILDVDWKNGVANLMVNGKKFVLRGDSSYLISYDWGIRFGSTRLGSSSVYDRIEVLKRGMVHEVLRSVGVKSKEAGFTGFSEENYWNDAFNQFNYYNPTDSVK